jgi:hypothetical protein
MASKNSASVPIRTTELSMFLLSWDEECALSLGAVVGEEGGDEIPALGESIFGSCRGGEGGHTYTPASSHQYTLTTSNKRTHMYSMYRMLNFFSIVIQKWPSNFSESEDAGIEPRTLIEFALIV